MFTDIQAAGGRLRHQPSHREPMPSEETRVLSSERTWRESEQSAGTLAGDITISRWSSLSSARREQATTPHGQYFFAIALKAVRLQLSRGSRTIFDSIMPAGTLYVSAPSAHLTAQFHGPCDFLHFYACADRFSSQQPGMQPPTAESLNDLILLRDPLVEQLARALIAGGHSADHEFARCIAETLVMHIVRREPPRAKVNVLPKWRLRRVEEYVRTNFDHGISLSDLAGVAGLSRMHFAAQFRATTGYRPREYLLHQRIEHAKSLLANSEMALAEVALAVGFCTQAHFSTVFKRITGNTPASWRCDNRNALASSGLLDDDEPVSARKPASRALPADQRRSCKMRKSLGS